VVFAKSANYHVSVAGAQIMLFHHVDRIARKVVPRVFSALVVERMSPKEPPGLFRPLFVQQHCLGAQKDPESAPSKAQAKIVVDVVNKEFLAI